MLTIELELYSYDPKDYVHHREETYNCKKYSVAVECLSDYFKDYAKTGETLVADMWFWETRSNGTRVLVQYESRTHFSDGFYHRSYPNYEACCDKRLRGYEGYFDLDNMEK